MTVSAYIVNLLSNYEGIEIDTNHVADGSDKYGLFKSPSRNITEFNDNSYEITEFYQLIARQKTVSNSERKEADEFLEDLTYWIDDFSTNYEYPELGNNRKVSKIAITGCPYPMIAEDKDIEYQLSISITYLRERKEF